MCASGCLTLPYVVLHRVGVFPKWLPVLPGSIHRLIAVGPINFMEIGTPVTGPFFNVTVAVPLYVLAIVFFVRL